LALGAAIHAKPYSGRRRDMAREEALGMIARLEQILDVLKSNPEMVDAMIFTYKTKEILPGFRSHVRRMGMGSVPDQAKLLFNYITGIEDDLGITITQLAEMVQE
jgi:hypothetical protein